MGTDVYLAMAEALVDARRQGRLAAFAEVRGIMEGPSAAVHREYAAGWDACWAYVLAALDRLEE